MRCGSLAPWHHRRAIEYLDAHVDGNLTIVDLARQCSLSATYFTPAFKRSAGRQRLEPKRRCAHSPRTKGGEIKRDGQTSSARAG
jgi:AraC-like DNA-binding protein